MSLQNIINKAIFLPIRSINSSYSELGGVLNVEIRHSMPPINSCFIDSKTFGRNLHLHFQNTTLQRGMKALNG